MIFRTVLGVFSVGLGNTKDLRLSILWGPFNTYPIYFTFGKSVAVKVSSQSGKFEFNIIHLNGHNF